MEMKLLLEAFREIGEAASSPHTLAEALQHTLQALRPLFPKSQSSIMLLEAASNDLILVASDGLKEAESRLRFRVGEGVAGWAVREKRFSLVGDIASDARYVQKDAQTTPIRSIMCAPLFASGAVVGVLSVHSGERALTEEEGQACELVATRISSEVQRHWLEQLALTHSLTGLGNRRQYDRTMEVEVARAGRYRHPLSLAAFDVDGLKSVNDSRGHHAGDALLRAFGRRLRSLVRRPDHVCRTGGDEFAILLPETDLEGAHSLADRARASLSVHEPEGILAGLALSASFGIAAWRAGESAEELGAKADKAMYQAKKRGKNRVEEEGTA